MAKEAVVNVSDKKPKKNGFFKKIARFFKDLKSEIKKIVWPTKKQVRNNTVVVLTVVVISGIFIVGLDFLLGLLVKLILK